MVKAPKKQTLEFEQGEVIKWSNIDKEIEAYRGWIVEDGPKYDALAVRIATGLDRLEAAQVAGDPAVVRAIEDKLVELQLLMENANFVCKRMFAIRGFKYLKALLGEGSFTVDVDEFKFAIR